MLIKSYKEFGSFSTLEIGIQNGQIQLHVQHVEL